MSRPICRTAVLAVALLLSAPLAAQQAGATGADSLDRPPGNTTGGAAPTAVTADRAPAATTGARGERRDVALDAPYGTGFEARQRNFGLRGFGRGAGGAFGGGGRGGGRGR